MLFIILFLHTGTSRSLLERSRTTIYRDVPLGVETTPVTLLPGPHTTVGEFIHFQDLFDSGWDHDSSFTSLGSKTLREDSLLDDYFRYNDWQDFGSFLRFGVSLLGHREPPLTRSVQTQPSTWHWSTFFFLTLFLKDLLQKIRLGSQDPFTYPCDQSSLALGTYCLLSTILVFC